jgi:branched-chain amino acid transport system permease protein
VLGVFLLGVILFLPRGIGSLWIRDRRKRRIPAAAPLTAEPGAAP